MADTIETRGFLELTEEIEKMADLFIDTGGEASGLAGIVKAGAEVVLAQAKLNAPVGETGNLQKDLKVVMKSKGARIKARVGVQKGDKAFYATFVEFGHGGPHPAGPHPFLKPAMDLKREEALSVIKAGLKAKLNNIV